MKIKKTTNSCSLKFRQLSQLQTGSGQMVMSSLTHPPAQHSASGGDMHPSSRVGAPHWFENSWSTLNSTILCMVSDRNLSHPIWGIAPRTIYVAHCLVMTKLRSFPKQQKCLCIAAMEESVDLTFSEAFEEGWQLFKRANLVSGYCWDLGSNLQSTVKFSGWLWARLAMERQGHLCCPKPYGVMSCFVHKVAKNSKRIRDLCSRADECWRTVRVELR